MNILGRIKKYRIPAITILILLPNITVVAKSNTSTNYTENLVIDIAGTRKTEAADLATLMKGTVSTLPKSEIKPASDILIIVGKDSQ